jgi:hypothetical protein
MMIKEVKPNLAVVSGFICPDLDDGYNSDSTLVDGEEAQAAWMAEFSDED